MSLVPNRLFCECCGEYCANDEDFLLHLRGHQTEEQEFFAELQRQRVEGFDAEVSTTEEGIEGPSELPEEGAREDGASVEESGSSRISRANKGEDESGGEGVQQPSEAAQTTDDTGALQVRGGGGRGGSADVCRRTGWGGGCRRASMPTPQAPSFTRISNGATALCE